MSEVVLNEAHLKALRQIIQGLSLTILDVNKEKDPAMANALMEEAFNKVRDIIVAARHVDGSQVGVAVADERVLCHNLLGGRSVVVEGTQSAKEVWPLAGRLDGELKVLGTCMYGKYPTAVLCRFIRNGIFSIAMKGQRHSANRAARKAAAAEQSQSVQ